MKFEAQEGTSAPLAPLEDATAAIRTKIVINSYFDPKKKTISHEF